MSRRSEFVYRGTEMTSVHPITVSVIGAGGNGSYLIGYLATLNEALIALTGNSLMVDVYDDDVVMEHNIGRQMFSLADVQSLKAEAVIARVNAMYGLSWKAYPMRLNESITFATNIMITATDNVKSRKLVSEMKPNTSGDAQMYRPWLWIDTGVQESFGQVWCSIWEGDRYTFDIFESHDLQDQPEMPSCSMVESLTRQKPFVNSFAALIAVKMLTDFIVKGYCDRASYFNLEQNTWKSTGSAIPAAQHHT